MPLKTHEGGFYFIDSLTVDDSNYLWLVRSGVLGSCTTLRPPRTPILTGFPDSSKLRRAQTGARLRAG
jgi:hypothetical protein